MLPISVIIPVYNRANVVRSAIESIFLQRVVDEIVVVDDASTDDLYRILKPYRARLRYIRVDRNSGVSASRNIGVTNSRNDIIAFLDSDDIFLPNKISLQYNYMIDAGYKISHTDELWLRDGRWVNQGISNRRFGGDIFCNVLDKCRVSPSSLMLHRDVFDKVGLFDESLRVCEDYEFMLRASLLFDIGYLKKNLIVKRAFLDDQLSKSIKFIESIRKDILIKFYSNYADKLTAERRDAVEAEILRKSSIVKV